MSITSSPQKQDLVPLSFDVNTIETWIFDLDNTLYPAKCNLFDQIDVRMTQFIADHLQIDPVEARKKQKDFYHKYGTSLRGLMQEHDMDPDPFLDHVHDIDVSGLEPAPHMAAAIDRLPGRKVVYTNGTVAHAQNVLSALGLDQRMDVIHGIETCDYIPKPDPYGYRLLCQHYDIDPKTALMVEDSLKNLVTAKSLGMATVLVEDTFGLGRAQKMTDEKATQARACVDIFIEDTAEWLLQLTTT